MSNPKVAEKRTAFVVENVHRSTTTKDLAKELGLNDEVSIIDSTPKYSRFSTASFTVKVGSLDVAMAIFRKHNFQLYREHHISMNFVPNEVYNRIPMLEIEAYADTQPVKVYEFFSRRGTVVSVNKMSTSRSWAIFRVYFAEKAAAIRAKAEMIPDSATYGSRHPAATIDRYAPTVISSKNIDDTATDFWTPPTETLPQKARGNLIGVPTNIKVPNNTATPIVTHVIKPILGSSRSSRSSRQQNTTVPPVPKKTETARTAALQRSNKYFRPIVPPEHVVHPGEIVSRHCSSRLFDGPHSHWCACAFMCYETFYNTSSKSTQGLVSISTLAWGAQLDISTFRMHYGSIFSPNDSLKQVPIASCLTVEMRQYGDKDSAAEVLAIRNNGGLSETCNTMVEGVNITARGKILSMKCIESGHLVTSSNSSQDSTLNIWDMREDNKEAVNLASLKSSQRGKLWIDAQRMDICSVDQNGTVCHYDATKTIQAGVRGVTLDYTSKTDLEESRSLKYYSSCISINASDSTVLVGSNEHAQVARWDLRSPKMAAFVSLACQRKEASSSSRKFYDPVYDVEWNPTNANEFMTVHARTVRVWDARKMDQDSYATFHRMGNGVIRKARWSPHKDDTIATLDLDGQVKIWKLNKFDKPADRTTLTQDPEMLFVHQGNKYVLASCSLLSIMDVVYVIVIHI
ncbi:hypothetical protein BG011_001986 [Mortierella polycephala]|uniref:WD40 repeat-like protein n=1 Tax=Mortierella polycephala TaxID=41804 RepID=A0A9P6Q7I8_9FUNG|nr:hypothetical protein BG011_001986 [Mortierella polycephala]